MEEDIYISQYNILIETARLRNWPVNISGRQNGVYTEVHHIIPRCIGGTDDEGNLVRLTGQEHFNAHILLYKAYPNISGLALAAHRVSYIKDIEIDADTYNELKEKHANAISEVLTGIKRSVESKKKYSESKSGKKNPQYGKPLTLSQKEKMSKKLSGNGNGMFGKTHTDEVKALLSKLHSGKQISEWQRSRIKESNTGSKNFFYGKNHTKETKELMKQSWENREEISCPYCSIRSKNMANMKRWHFNNCKKKENNGKI